MTVRMAQLRTRMRSSAFWQSALLVGVGSLLLGITLGLLTAVVPESRQSLLPVLAVSFALLIPLLAQRKYNVYYVLLATIASATIAREALNFPMEVDLALVIILVLVLLLKMRGAIVQPGQYRPIIWPMVLFLFLNYVVAWTISPLPEASLRQTSVLAYRVITFYAVVMAVRQFPQKRSRYPFWLGMIMVAQVVLALLGIVLRPYVTLPFIQYRLIAPLSIRGTFQEANLLAIFLLCTLTLLTAVQMYRGRWQLKRFLLFLIIGLTGLLLAQTRSAWIGFLLVFVLMSIIIFMGTNQRARTYVFLYGSGLVFLGIVFMPLLYIYNASTTGDVLIGGIFARLNNIVSANSSVIGRLRAWELAYESIIDHPWFGTGFLSYQGPNFNTEGVESAWLYNFVIQSLHDSGIVGTLLLGLFYALCLGYIWRGYRQASAGDDKGALLGYFLAIIALFFTSLFSSFVWGAFAWILIGLGVGHSLIILQPSAVPNQPDPDAASIMTLKEPGPT